MATDVLLAALVVAAACAVGAIAMTVWALSRSRTDLRYVREAGFGNGRLAAARGEYGLAWLRLLQALSTGGVVATLVWIGLSVRGLTVEPVWSVVVFLLVLSTLAITASAWWANRVRREVLRQGILKDEGRQDCEGTSWIGHEKAIKREERR